MKINVLIKKTFFFFFKKINIYMIYFYKIKELNLLKVDAANVMKNKVIPSNKQFDENIAICLHSSFLHSN